MASASDILNSDNSVRLRLKAKTGDQTMEQDLMTRGTKGSNGVDRNMQDLFNSIVDVKNSLIYTTADEN